VGGFRIKARTVPPRIGTVRRAGERGFRGPLERHCTCSPSVPATLGPCLTKANWKTGSPVPSDRRSICALLRSRLPGGAAWRRRPPMPRDLRRKTPNGKAPGAASSSQRIADTGGPGRTFGGSGVGCRDRRRGRASPPRNLMFLRRFERLGGGFRPVWTRDYRRWRDTGRGPVFPQGGTVQGRFEH
jgi:hypothetical protein